LFLYFKNLQYDINMKKTFTEKVLAIVEKIPKGKVMTYKQVAAKACSPNASRAVGSIMKANYNPKVPCHRVIRSDGVIGNYNRGGAEAKRALLKKEGALQ
jgi:O-6-methylguanine DNA methyltransferase